MKIGRPFLLFFLAATLLVSCSDDKKYLAAKAVVVDTKHRHWGKGFFKVEVYYRYFNGKDSVTAHSTADGMELSYTSDYFVGDSLKIGYNPTDSSDTFIVKTTYRNRKRK